MKGGMQVGTKHGMRRLIRNGLLLSLTLIKPDAHGLLEQNSHTLYSDGNTVQYVNNLRIKNLIVTGVR